MAIEKKKYKIIEGVINGGPPVDLPKPITRANIQQVWTVLHKERLKAVGLAHNYSAFVEDRMHDWDLTKDGQLRFYGHSGGKDEVHTLAIVYK